jgi:hypothetical protein
MAAATAVLAILGLVAILLTSAELGKPAPAFAAGQAAPAKLSARPCLQIADAAGQSNKDICVTAHVYDVVELADGTRFLDVCPKDVPDEQCRFTLVSLRADRDDVGDLRKYRDQQVNVRGIVRATHGRMGIQISHIRQFSGGPEKFRPNPRLLHDFNGQSDRMPVRDPNLAGSGRHRTFMNTSDKEQLAPASKH